MDKFEQSMMTFSKLSIEEKKQGAKKMAAICICPDCPTYNDCAKDAKEVFYCAHGSSFHCISEEMSCICASCPITEQFGLTHDFFCTRQSEESQRWSEELMSRK